MHIETYAVHLVNTEKRKYFLHLIYPSAYAVCAMRIRTTITLNDKLYEKAKAMMEEGNFDEFSGFLEYLIRTAYESRSEREKQRILEIIDEMRKSAIGDALLKSQSRFPKHGAQGSAMNETPP